MPNPNAIVDVVSSVARTPGPEAAVPGRDLVTVQFAGSRTATLDISTERGRVWSEVLQDLGQSSTPVYVDVDPGSGTITNVLIPLIVKVERVATDARGDAVVDLLISHARHYVRRSRPDFDELVNTLRSARQSGTTVAVTETEASHEIIDVRIVPSPPAASAEIAAPPEVEEGPSFAADVSLNQAQQMFNLVQGKFCCPVNPTAPCIPFTYPDDGCWGRAHEMCRLMIAAGIQPDKVWIYGSLRTPTQNHPNCQVPWGWHVAPTLRVSSGGSSQTYVIDPSLFPGPVTQPTWKGVQGDPNAQLVPTTAAVFHRSFGGSVIYDPTYVQTNQVLNTYRNQLRLRSVSAVGPPPYVNCMTPTPGVQFRGVIAGGATARWFTFAWPAAWHVVWTVMPLTICPGGPQLTWRVQVERANATQCTYWIVVQNLTSSAVKFEGRFDVLKR